MTDVDADIDLHIAQGSVALDAFGVLIAKGSFSVTLGQVTDAGVDGVFDTADDVTYQAMSLELGRNAHGTATDIEVFCRRWRRSG